jgi:xylulokinase
MSEVILAVDLGAGSLRVGAVTPLGRLGAAVALPIAAEEPTPGWSEIDPETWWRTLGEGVARVLAMLPGNNRILAFCLAGLTRSQVLLDRDGRALRPALLFRDRRAAENAEPVAGYFPTDNPAEAVTAFHPLTRLAWVAQHEPASFGRLHAVLEPKDFLNFRLTGRIAADTVTYSRFDSLVARARPLPAWLARGLDLLAIERVAPWAMLGAITCRDAPFDRLARVPVFAGAMDAWASAVGSGAVRPGQGYDIAGTSEVVGLLGRRRGAATGLVSLLWGEGIHQLGGPTQIGADAARWCHETFRVKGRLAAAVERAGARPPSDALPLFLPYLAGERAPLWRADLRGAFHNLTRAAGPDDFLQATLEGVAHAIRDILDTAATATGEPLAELRVSGGGARSDAWCQIKADVLGAKVVRVRHAETGLVGAAIAAAIGLGCYASLDAAAEAMCPIDRIFAPRAPLAAGYARRAALYRLAKDAALALADAAAIEASSPTPARHGRAPS